MFTEIIEQIATQEEFNSMNWDRPIIRHEIANHIHFIAIDRDYLDAMLLGIGTFQSLAGLLEE